MSEPNHKEDEGTPSTGTPPAVGRERLASIWKALAFTFVGTLVVAAVVFVSRKELLTSELQDHYSRSAARQAREMELAYANFHSVLTNLTRLADPVGEVSATRLRADAATARLNALVRAEQRVQLLAPSTEARLQSSDAKREQLGRELAAASEGLSSADAALRDKQRKAALAEQTLATARLDASAKVQSAALRAKEAGNRARAAAEAAAAALTAETHADAADRTGATPEELKAHAAVAAQARDAAQVAADVSSTPAVGSGSGRGAGAGSKAGAGTASANTRGRPAALPAGDPKKAAADAAERAKKAALVAALAARDTQKVADQAEVDVDALVLAADEARTHAVTSFVARQLQTKAMQALEYAIEAESRENARNAERLRVLDLERRALSNDLQLAAEERDGIAALMNGLRANILPSYRDEVDACVTQNLATPKDAELCAAREMARAVEAPGAAPTLEIAACPTGSEHRPKAALTADGKSLVFAPTPGTRALSACGYVPLAKLVTSSDVPGAPADPSSARPFDEVLLVRPDGKQVFAREGGSNLRVTSLPGIDAKGVHATQIVAGVQIGPRKYRAFLQPVSIAVADACPDGGCAAKQPQAGASPDAERVVFSGLVAEDRLVSEGLEVSPGFFLWAILLLCFGLLAIPLAKLWLVGPTSRFRRFDVALLAVSALATTLLTVMLVLATTIYAGLVERLDQQISTAGERVTKHVVALVEKAVTDLDAYQADAASLIAAVPQGEPDGASLQAFQKACLTAADAETPRPFCGKRDVITYPAGNRGRSAAVCEQVRCGFNAAGGSLATIGFVADRLGNQWARASFGAHAPNPTNIADRSYFQRALRGELSCFDERTKEPAQPSATQGSCRTRAAAEIVRSNTLGEVVLVVARPTKGPTNAGATGVIGVARPLSGFENTVLPLGMEIAVVDRLGRVMVHSDGDTRQGQYLLGDFGKPDELGAAMAAGVPAIISMRYRGSPSRVRVEWLPSLDWFVIAVAPRGLVDVVTANIVGFSLVGWGILLPAWLLVMVPLVWIARWWRKHRGPTADAVPFLSVRPNSNEVSSYFRVGVFMLGGSAAVLVMAVLFDLPTGPVLFVSVLAATFGLISFPGVGFFASSRERPSNPSLSQSQTAWWHGLGLRHHSRTASLSTAYSLCCFGVAAIAVVAPTFILVESARDHTLDNLARAEQSHYALRVGDQECLRRLAAGAVDPSDQRCANVFPWGLQQPPDSTLQPRSDSCWLWPAPCVAERLPVLESSHRRASGRLYRAPNFKRIDDSVTMAGIVATKLPSLRAPHVRYFAVGVVVLLVLAVLGYLIARASTKRLLVLRLLERLQEARELPPEEVLPDPVPDGHRCLVINPSPNFRAAIALRAVGPVLLIADLDARLSDLVCLDVLERALYNPKAAIVLLSKREPMHQAPPELAARWASVLQGFTVHQGPPFAEPSLDPGLRDIPPARLAAHWNACTKEEQRLLAQLATEGYVNPHMSNHRPLAELAGRGLLDVHTLTIQHDKFKEFAAGQVSQTEFAKWEKDDSSSVYRSLRVPLLAGVVLIFAVVTAVNPGLAAVAPLVPALAAGLPPLLKILAGVMSGKSSA